MKAFALACQPQQPSLLGMASVLRPLAIDETIRMDDTKERLDKGSPDRYASRQKNKTGTKCWVACASQGITGLIRARNCIVINPK